MRPIYQTKVEDAGKRKNFSVTSVIKKTRVPPVSAAISIGTLFVAVLLLFNMGQSNLIAGNKQSSKSSQVKAKKLIDRIPLGTDKSNVMKYLNANRVQHSTYSPNGTQYIIQAIVRGNLNPSLFQCDTSITFRFNAKGKLISCEMKKQITGP